MISYLASPYSPMNGESIEERVEAACRCAARLMSMGHVVFSPIAHSHGIADFMSDDLRLDHEFWMRQDLPILMHCDRVFVLRLNGWEKSRGVAREIDVATKLGIPVEYIDP